MSGGPIGGQVEGGTGRSRHSCRAARAHTGCVGDRLLAAPPWRRTGEVETPIGWPLL
jgi:hypothetical protein